MCIAKELMQYEEDNFHTFVKVCFRIRLVERVCHGHGRVVFLCEFVCFEC